MPTSPTESALELKFYRQSAPPNGRVLYLLHRKEVKDVQDYPTQSILRRFWRGKSSHPAKSLDVHARYAKAVYLELPSRTSKKGRDAFLMAIDDFMVKHNMF